MHKLPPCRSGDGIHYKLQFYILHLGYGFSVWKEVILRLDPSIIAPKLLWQIAVETPLRL